MTLHKIPIYSKESYNRSILIGRVTNIFLDPKDNTNPILNIYPGNLGIGCIEFEFVTNIDNLSKGYAKPLFPQFKYYPLINEIVFLIGGPSYNTSENSNNSELYYVNNFNSFNSPHINPHPKNSDNVSFGNTFIPKNIQSLLSFEGDYILEGRWGNSIRFGSTISGSKTLNPWSENGNNGDPITIIRNGQTYNSSSIDFNLEDINNDPSSVYITNGQQLPIDISSKNLATFNITLAKPNALLISVDNIGDTDSYDNIDK